MTAGAIISGVIYGLVALLMIGIGIHQFRSKDPVGFYTGEKPPQKEQITDVRAWNRKHGIMWIIYGICIVLSWVCSTLIGDSLYAVIPLAAGILLIPVVIIICHHRLVKKYYKKEQT